MLKKIFIGFLILVIIGVIGLVGAYQYWKSQMPPWPERLDVDLSVPEYNHIRMEEVKPGNAAYYIYQLTEPADEQPFLEEGKSYTLEDVEKIIAEQEKVRKFDFSIFGDVDYENWDTELEAKIDAEIAKYPETFETLEKALACDYCEFALISDPFFRMEELRVPASFMLGVVDFFNFKAKKNFESNDINLAYAELIKASRLISFLRDFKPVSYLSDAVYLVCIEKCAVLPLKRLQTGTMSSDEANYFYKLMRTVENNRFSWALAQKLSFKYLEKKSSEKAVGNIEKLELLKDINKHYADFLSYYIQIATEYDKTGVVIELPKTLNPFDAANLTSFDDVYFAELILGIIGDSEDKFLSKTMTLGIIRLSSFDAYVPRLRTREFQKSKIVAITLVLEAWLYREKFGQAPKKVSVLYSELFKEKDFLRAKTSGNTIKYEVIDGKISISVDHPLYTEKNFSIKF